MTDIRSTNGPVFKATNAAVVVREDCTTGEFPTRCNKVRVIQACMSNENFTSELGPHNVPHCSQLTYKADQQIAKEILLELCKETINQCILRIF